MAVKKGLRGDNLVKFNKNNRFEWFVVFGADGCLKPCEVEVDHKSLLPVRRLWEHLGHNTDCK